MNNVADDDDEDEEAATAEDDADEDDDTAEDESPPKKAAVQKKKPDAKKEENKEVEAKGSANDKKPSTTEKNLALGEIAKVNEFITNTKVEGLQPLHTVSEEHYFFSCVWLLHIICFLL